MEGERIAEYGRYAVSVTYFGINTKWVVILSVTYGTSPVISKAYIEWNRRKVFA